MRVISGTARGLKLDSPEGSDTRPTLDNVKEAIFSMLFDKVRGAVVLDLFAGSGALGIEALSRGAQCCVFSDCSYKATEIIRKNCDKAHLADRSEIIKADYEKVICGLSQKCRKFDIIFLDPPYAQGLLDTALSLIREHQLLAPDGVVVTELDFGTIVDIPDYNLLKDKKYGRVCIKILEAKC